MAQNVGIRITR